MVGSYHRLNRFPLQIHESKRFGNQYGFPVKLGPGDYSVVDIFLLDHPQLTGQLFNHHKPHIVAGVFVFLAGVPQPNNQLHLYHPIPRGSRLQPLRLLPLSRLFPRSPEPHGPGAK